MLLSDREFASENLLSGKKEVLILSIRVSGESCECKESCLGIELTPAVEKRETIGDSCPRILCREKRKSLYCHENVSTRRLAPANLSLLTLTRAIFFLVSPA